MHQQLFDIGGARVGKHAHHRHKHQHRAEERVKEELEARVDPLLAAPDADDQEHRDQPRLEEEVKQNQIQRHEHAQHQCLEHQESDHVFLDAGFHVPTGRNHQWHHECRQHHKENADPIHAQFVLQTQQPFGFFYELHARVIGVEPGQNKERHKERGPRRDQREPFGVAVGRCVIAAQEHREDQRCQRRDKGDNRQKVVHQFAPPLIVIHVTRTAIPITIAKT